MATFYLLPPRPVFEAALANFLRNWLPGVQAEQELTEALYPALHRREETFLIFREDLADGVKPVDALLDGYGAGLGDEVIELQVIGGPGEVRARSWRVGDVFAA